MKIKKKYYPFVTCAHPRSRVTYLEFFTGDTPDSSASSDVTWKQEKEVDHIAPVRGLGWRCIFFSGDISHRSHSRGHTGYAVFLTWDNGLTSMIKVLVYIFGRLGPRYLPKDPKVLVFFTALQVTSFMHDFIYVKSNWILGILKKNHINFTRFFFLNWRPSAKE